MKKQEQINNDDPEFADHNLEKKAVTFSTEIDPKLTPVMHHSCQEFVSEAEDQFIKMMYTESIGDELESQELCLLKHDYLTDL